MHTTHPPRLLPTQHETLSHNSLVLLGRPCCYYLGRRRTLGLNCLLHLGSSPTKSIVPSHGAAIFARKTGTIISLWESVKNDSTSWRQERLGSKIPWHNGTNPQRRGNINRMFRSFSFPINDFDNKVEAMMISRYQMGPWVQCHLRNGLFLSPVWVARVSPSRRPTLAGE